MQFPARTLPTNPSSPAAPVRPLFPGERKHEEPRPAMAIVHGPVQADHVRDRKKRKISYRLLADMIPGNYRVDHHDPNRDHAPNTLTRTMSALTTVLQDSKATKVSMCNLTPHVSLKIALLGAII